MRQVAILCALVGALVWAGAAAADVKPTTSSNWSGYAIADPDTISEGTPTTPFTFSNVTATWRQPQASCTMGTSAFSAFWVGLGGYANGSQGLEQIGTDSDCATSGKPTYYAWYELVPAPSTRVSLKVYPGDTITGAVVVNGQNVLVQLKDRTRKTSFTKSLFMDTPDVSSAEWIAEAPAECISADRCRVLPLANFGTVSFTKIAATANAHPGTLSDTTWSSAAISLVPDSRARTFFGVPDNASTAGATPAASTPDGRDFTVNWVANATLP